ncbi:MAG TPA: MDR family MFS transporter [Ktedonobacteraceae bacterium]|nr:MDR family MFS transporter [Ktedonobacteraceae bacterium]
MATQNKNTKIDIVEKDDEWGERRLQGAPLVSVIIALMLTLLLEALDQTIVGTAMPRVIASLQGFDRYTWVITSYVLASTTMIPVVGKLSDLFGRKWFLVAGTAIFLLGSVLSGASQSMNQLIVFRCIQGLGAGIGIALVVTVVGDIFPPAERARWQGAFGAVYGISNLIGPTLGGWLADHGPLLGGFVGEETRWRWVFYINFPVGILALLTLLVFLPTDLSVRTSTTRGWQAFRSIDFAGAILAAAATTCLLLGLTWGSNQLYDWNSLQVIGTLVAAGVLYALFFVVECLVAEPILPLDLFRNQVFTVATILSLLQMMVLVGVVLYLPFFLQGVLGVSATNSGATMTPQSVATVIGAALAGMLISFIKRYRIITLIGALIMTLGVFLLSRMDASTGIGLTILYMVIAGLGLGTFFSVLNLAAQNALPRSRLGVGTAAVRYLGQLGATLGIAVVGTVVNSTLASDIKTRVSSSVIQQLTPAGWKAATDPQVLISSEARNGVVQAAQHFATQNVPPGPQHDATVQQITVQVPHMLDQVFAALKLSLVTAIQHGLLTVLIFCVAMVIGAIFLKDLPMQEASKKSAATESIESDSSLEQTVSGVESAD